MEYKTSTGKTLYRSKQVKKKSNDPESEPVDELIL